MCCQKESFLSKIKPRYFQVSFGYRIGPPRGFKISDWSREMKDFWLFMFDYKSKLVKEKRNNVIATENKSICVTNFIQLVSPQPVDQFSQTKLCYKAPNEGYLHTYGMYKSDNKQLRYKVISNCKIFVC